MGADAAQSASAAAPPELSGSLAASASTTTKDLSLKGSADFNAVAANFRKPQGITDDYSLQELAQTDAHGIARGILLMLLFASLAMWTVYLMVVLYLDNKNRKIRAGTWYNKSKQRNITSQYHEVMEAATYRWVGVFSRIVVVIALYMVVLGISGYNRDGLNSVAWTNQTPPSLDAFFAGASNIIFTFGGHAMLLEVMDSMFHPYKFHKVFYASYSYVYTLIMPNSIFIYWGWPAQAAQYGNVYAYMPPSVARDFSIVLMVLHQVIVFGLVEKAVGVHEGKHWKRVLVRLPIAGLLWLIALAFPFFGTFIIPPLAYNIYYQLKKNARQNREESAKPPNRVIIAFTAVFGLGMGGYASVKAFVDDVSTFGVFAACYMTSQSVAISVLLYYHTIMKFERAVQCAKGSRSVGGWEVAANIRAYMVERLGIAPDEVAELCTELYLTYGTTLAGLVAKGHVIDYDDWHLNVHATLDYESYLAPDPELRSLLESLPAPKWVFTNADAAHAERCLAILGVRHCFRGVVCFESVMAAAAARGWSRHGRPVVCKPNRQAYALAAEAAGGPAPAATLWLDDSTRNITAGHRLGWQTVLVGRTGVDTPADHQIARIHDLRTAMPWLWQATPPPAPPLAPRPPRSPRTSPGRRPQLQQQQERPGKGEPALVCGGPGGEPLVALS
eukprot:scaffold6.g2750.t1